VASWVTDWTNWSAGEKRALAMGYVAADGIFLAASGGNPDRWRIVFPANAGGEARRDALAALLCDRGVTNVVTDTDGNGKYRVTFPYANACTEDSTLGYNVGQAVPLSHLTTNSRRTIWLTAVTECEGDTCHCDGRIVADVKDATINGTARTALGFLTDVMAVCEAVGMGTNSTVCSGGVPTGAKPTDETGLYLYKLSPSCDYSAPGNECRWGLHAPESYWRLSTLGDDGTDCACSGGSASSNSFHASTYNSHPFYPFHGYGRVPGGAP
jgi:hypothetical protein